MSADDRNVDGVSQAVRSSGLAAHLASPEGEVATWHLRRSHRVRRDEPFCGADSQRMTDATDVVTCPACKAVVTDRNDRAEVALLRTLTKSPRSIHRMTWPVKLAGRRLEAKGEAVAKGPALWITDLGRSRLESPR